MTIIETDMLIYKDVVNPFNALASVNMAWRHSSERCAKALAIHRYIPDIPGIVMALTDNHITITDCSCMTDYKTGEGKGGTVGD